MRIIYPRILWTIFLVHIVSNIPVAVSSAFTDSTTQDSSSSTSNSSSLPSTTTASNNCTQRILISQRYPLEKHKAPPETMPTDLVWAYTRCNTIPIGKYYVDDTLNGQGIHTKFSNKEINRYLTSAKTSLDQVKNKFIRKSLGKKGWIPLAFHLYADYIIDKHAIVFGSMSPLIETLLLAIGVKNITTVEYNQLTYSHPQIRTITPDQLQEEFRIKDNNTATTIQHYDIAVSISSFDHDGLGRYGDPLSPDGDLLSNDEIKNVYLKPGGIYFLTIPIGPDIVVWNLHRRYGNIRLPLLLDGWDIIDRVGWNDQDNLLTKEVPFTISTEPVFVLQSPGGEQRIVKNEEKDIPSSSPPTTTANSKNNVPPKPTEASTTKEEF